MAPFKVGEEVWLLSLSVNLKFKKNDSYEAKTGTSFNPDAHFFNC